jgi:long-chain acyl-CoA synthetase
MKLDTIVDRLFAHSHLIGDKAAVWYQEKRTWKNYTWAQYADAVEKFAGALLGLGFEAGDCTVIMGNNSPEWLIADVGTMAARGCPAGIYQTSTQEQALYVANHCEAKVFVLENMTYFQALELDTVRDQLPHVKKFVLVQDAEKIDHPDVISFADFLASGESLRGRAKERRAEILGSDLATLIYTSGTTGPPKGVMLSHENLGWTALAAVEAVGDVQPSDCVVSYLPLSHIAEQMFSLHLAITAGYPVWCCEDISKIKDTLVIARPTLFLAVPRVWEKFRTALEMKFADATGAKRMVVDFALKTGRDAGTIIVEKGEDALPLPLKLQNTLAQKAFGSKLRAALGLDRLRIAVSGAAPIGKDVLDFFLATGIIIHEVYGQSEGSGPSSFNFPKPGERRIGSVGKAFPGCELKIAEDGEILVRGPNVFMGYYKEPQATAETLINGWLHSGDVGRIDSDGFLYITDRKKDLIITAGGKNVAPQNIEKLLRNIDGVGNTVVIGDRRKFLAALLTIDAERGPALAKERGWPTDVEELAKNKDFLDFIQSEVDRINTELARYESIRKFAVLPHDFTTESGELTPTQKVKRKVVNDRHAATIEGMYEGLD